MFIGQCIHDIATTHGLVISLFLAGLFGGFTHCAGMCSPFVLAQLGPQTELKRIRSSLLIPYHLGRMTTYVTLAILVSSVINLAFVFSGLKALIAAPLLVLAGVIFLVSALPQLSSIFPWVAHIRLAAPYKFIVQFSSKLMRNPNALKRYGLGILLGFMPCGLVVAALLASASAPNAVQAAIAMGAFTFGTMPALILVAFGGNMLKKKYPRASMRITQGAMVISGLWLFALAGQLLL
tara:strand:+ start:7422 stop:8132 length:711 start_codon:yes stop_codon:yes gene_type:complete